MWEAIPPFAAVSVGGGGLLTVRCRGSGSSRSAATAAARRWRRAPPGPPRRPCCRSQQLGGPPLTPPPRCHGHHHLEASLLLLAGRKIRDRALAQSIYHDFGPPGEVGRRKHASHHELAIICLHHRTSHSLPATRPPPPLPQLNAAVIARRGQQAGLGGVPPHAVDVQWVRLLAPAQQAERGSAHVTAAATIAINTIPLLLLLLRWRQLRPHEQLPHARCAHFARLWHCCC